VQDLDLFTLRSAITDFLNSRKLGNLSPRTIIWYAEKLNHLFEGLDDTPLPQITLAVVRGRIADRQGTMKAETLNGHIRAAKAFFNWLLAEEYQIAFDPRKLKLMKVEHRLPPTLTVEQLTQLLAAPDRHTWVGQRDHCLLALFVDTGIRLSEALSLRLLDLNNGDGTVTVIGKGNKQRIVALSMPMRRILRRWLKVRQQQVRKMNGAEHWLFFSRYGERLTGKTVHERVQRYGKVAGIEGVRVSPHTFRSTFATHFCKQGGSIVHLQTILGHTSLEMSRRYAAVTDQDAFEASRRYSMLGDGSGE
jgi:integrase/recombinase XerD